MMRRAAGRTSTRTRTRRSGRLVVLDTRSRMSLMAVRNLGGLARRTKP